MKESSDVTKNVSLERVPVVIVKRLNLTSPSHSRVNSAHTVKSVFNDFVPQSKFKPRKILKGEEANADNNTTVSKRNGSNTRIGQKYLDAAKPRIDDEECIDLTKEIYVDLEKTWKSIKIIQRDLELANVMHCQAKDNTKASNQEKHPIGFIKPESLIFQVNSLMYREWKNPKHQLGLSTGWDYNRCSASPSLCESDHKEETVCEQMTECFITLKNQLAYTSFLENGLYTLTTWTSPQAYFSPLLLRILLNLIMSVRDESQVKCIEGAISRHWTYHPPCRPGMVKVYTEFLMATIIDTSLSIELSGQILPLILKRLENEFDWLETHLEGEDENTKSAKKPKRVLFKYSYEALKEREKKLREEGSSEPLIQDFVLESDEEYEIHGHFKNTQFIDLKHRVRLERLTVALRLIVDLMEQDMVVWLGKYNSDPHKAMESEETNPLIARVMWQSTRVVGTTDDICLHILKLLHKTGAFPELRAVFLLHVIRLHLKKGKKLPANKGKGVPSQQHLVMLENRIPVVKIPKVLLFDNEPVTYPSKQKDINKRSPTGETLLSLKIKKKKISDVIGILCHPDVDVNISDCDGYTVLHKAVAGNALEIVEALLNYVPIKQGLKPVDLRARFHGRTLLMEAVMYNRVEIAKLILDASGPVALTDEDEEGRNVLAMATTSEMKALIGTAVASDSDRNVRLTLNANQLELLITHSSAYLDVYRVKELWFKLKNESSCVPQSTDDELNATELQFDYHMFSNAVSCFRDLRRFIRKLHKRVPESQLIAYWLLVLED